MATATTAPMTGPTTAPMPSLPSCHQNPRNTVTVSRTTRVIATGTDRDPTTCRWRKNSGNASQAKSTCTAIRPSQVRVTAVSQASWARTTICPSARSAGCPPVCAPGRPAAGSPRSPRDLRSLSELSLSELRSLRRFSTTVPAR
ncbi:hypothetical protein ACFFX0_26215 [Citricoccus parietis]|uniref:Uncharacterized protein n=1 Tax=Citricoccus parietis TaxID=592307 RepID=A0ABV5G6C0_9MICC